MNNQTTKESVLQHTKKKVDPMPIANGDSPLVSLMGNDFIRDLSDSINRFRTALALAKHPSELQDEAFENLMERQDELFNKLYVLRAEYDRSRNNADNGV